MDEKALLGSIIDLARTLGWKVAHTPPVLASVRGGGKRWMTPVQADGKGFPDLLLVRERVLAVEVKGGNHKPTPEQADWLAAFRIAGCHAFVWTPRDWADETVHAELARRDRRDPVVVVGYDMRSLAEMNATG